MFSSDEEDLAIDVENEHRHCETQDAPRDHVGEADFLNEGAGLFKLVPAHQRQQSEHGGCEPNGESDEYDVARCHV